MRVDALVIVPGEVDRFPSLVADLLVLGPMRNQTPMQGGHDAFAIDLANDRDLRAGCDIEAVRERVLIRCHVEVPLYRCLVFGHGASAQVTVLI